jgi:ABC-type amino acid transport substrate-binding protein
MNHRTCIAALVAVTLILAGADLFAQDSGGTLEKIAKSGEFLIGYRTDASPLSYENADGVPSGYSVDLCRRIAAAVKGHLGDSDIETKFVSVSSDERISAVASGKIDIECGSTTITLSRQEQVDFTIPTFVTGATILSLTETGIRGMSDLSGKKVGAVRDTTTVGLLRTKLQENLIDAEVVIVGSREEGMNRLNRGNIDAFASDQIVLIGQIIESTNPQRYALLDETFSYEPYGLVVRRDDADFRLLLSERSAYRDIQQMDRTHRHSTATDAGRDVSTQYDTGVET